MYKNLLFITAVLLTAQLQAQNITWIGANSTDWNTSANWSTGQVPTASNDVIITPATSQPVISAADAVAQTVEVQSGATLTVESAGSLAVNGSRIINRLNTAFYNGGTVENSGKVQIGNLSSVGNSGLQNQGTFNNNTGGQISIDRSVFTGLYNYSGTFNNAGAITIGANASVGIYGIMNDGTFVETAFYNNTGGQISIDNTSTYGLVNYSYGSTFTNAAAITIGANTSVGDDGLYNFSATFNNNTGGQIRIDRSGNAGLVNDGGTFINAAAITIGANASVGNYGLSIGGAFYNSTGGQIIIDRSSYTGLYNVGNFANAAVITIGATASVGPFGLFNAATFTNNTGGQISIDRSSYRGLQNAGTFTNAAAITIGATASVGPFGFYNESTFTNSNCATLSLFAPLYNQSSNLSNQGLMTVSTTGTHSNTGFTNNGVLVYPLANPIPNIGNEGVIASPLSICGSQITPALQLGASNPITIGSTWYSNTALSQSAGTYTNNTFTASGLNTGTTTVYFTISNGNCTQTVSIPVTLNNNPGDPLVFGNNVWNVYAWNDGNGTLTSSAWQNNYRGYYADTSFKFDTRWNANTSPSSASGYQGCTVNNDNHSWSAKRKGFPCGHYRISIPGHDDAAQLFINGDSVWQHDGCCDSHDNVWEGDLDADSKVEFRGTEGTQASYGAITFTNITLTITANGPTTVCAGSVVLSSSFAAGNQWYKNNVLIPGATNQTYSATVTGSYSVQASSLCGNQTSDAINITVTNPTGGDPAVFGNGIWNVYAWNAGDASNSNAQSWNANYSGYYIDSAVSFDTRNKWGSLLSPSAAQGYQGCPVGVDNHSWSAKRQGFDCGYYQISIPGHDDGAQLYINGKLEWQHINGCCDAHANVWKGYLNVDSKIEFRCTEGAGSSYGALDISPVKPVITASSSPTVCSGHSLVLTASVTGSDLLWSTGETTQSITVTQPGVYTVKETDTCGTQIESLPFTVNGPVAPGTNPSGSVIASTCGINILRPTGYPNSSQDYSFAWYKVGIANPVGNTFLANVSIEGDYYVVVSGNGCLSPPSSPVHVTVSSDPASIFGNNAWLVHTFQDENEDPDYPYYVYYGNYSDTTLSFNSQNEWPVDGSPSYAPGYIGCNVYEDFFKFNAKRRGFPCGHYKINIPGHDDWVKLWVNGEKVFEHDGSDDEHPNVWEGDLGPSSTIEFEVTEFYGDAYGAIDLELMSADITKPTITPSGPVNICSGDIITLISSAATGNTWSTGDTAQGITVNTAGNYSVTVTGSEGCTAQSDTVNITVHPPQIWYRDADGDGYGDPAISITACTAPAGYVANNTDCNDKKATVYPGAPELCDGLDNNCNGQIDEGGATWYRDADGDGYGNAAISTIACKKPAGYVANKKDCNDNDNTVYPGAPELCDGKDNNCNGTIDERCPLATVSINDVSISEGNKENKNMRFIVSLSAAATKKIIVQFATQDSTAIAGSDYSAKSGTVTFAPGITQQTVSISIIGDKTIEPDEIFKVNLSYPVNATIAKATGTGTIINDDGAAFASTVSAFGITESRSVKIAPNPVKSLLNIELSGYSGNVTLQLLSMEGGVLRQEKLQPVENYAKQQMTVAGIANGIYLLVVMDEKGNRQTEKVIIER